MSERIEKISRVYSGGNIYIRIKLAKNYQFDFSGAQSEDCFSVREAYESTKHIVYCDGE